MENRTINVFDDKTFKELLKLDRIVHNFELDVRDRRNASAKMDSIIERDIRKYLNLIESGKVLVNH